MVTALLLIIEFTAVLIVANNPKIGEWIVHKETLLWQLVKDRINKRFK